MYLNSKTTFFLTTYTMSAFNRADNNKHSIFASEWDKATRAHARMRACAHTHNHYSMLGNMLTCGSSSTIPDHG